MMPRSWPGWLALAASALLIGAGLALPDHPDASGWDLLALPLELPLLLLLLAVSGGSAGAMLRWMVTVVLSLVVLMKLTDLVMLNLLGRRFNPVGDLPLLDAAFRMLAGAAGAPLAVAAGLAALLVVAMLALGLFWAAGRWAGLAQSHPLGRRAALAGLGTLLLLLAVAAAAGSGRTGTGIGRLPGLSMKTVRYTLSRLEAMQHTLGDLRRFRQAAAEDTAPEAGQMLSGLDRDLLIVFVESYGRASFDTPIYAGTHSATLRQAETALAERGLSMRSGWVAAPTRGGQSWLSHATLATGLWIDDQSRYQAALASGRATLFSLARQAGLQTAAVMPAITRPWPEAAKMSFDRVLAAADLGYRGKPFNWVTMPDQFTLAALDRLLRSDGPRPPLVAQVALISSHAPWVPVPRLVDWQAIGDGRIFDQQAQAGDPPAVVWRDLDRVRVQYRLAVDYALQVIVSYAERHAGDPPLLIVLGDHQAAARIALDDRSDVPIHVIGPADLVARSADWGLNPGLIPAPSAPVIPMDRLRDLFLRSFSATGTTPDRSAAAGHDTTDKSALAPQAPIPKLSENPEVTR